ncbi:heterokaryon incompatibility protein [Colletotrichum camelliae]|nr:heterokaryon incompatibility protein [Colletotrichum camelliae]
MWTPDIDCEPNPSDMICGTCIGALHDRKGWVSSGQDESEPAILLAHHESIASLEASALEACEICHPFWSQIDEDERSRLREFGTQWAQRQGTTVRPRANGEKLGSFDGLVTICAIINLGAEDGMKAAGMETLLSVSLESDFRDECPLRKKDVTGTYIVQRGPGRNLGKMTPFLSNTTASEEAWAKATTWIETCCSNHQACNVEAAAEAWYPTRLLDLSAPDLDLGTLRLIVTSDEALECKQRYTTLSHCWGSAQFVQLKKSTHEDFRKRIQLSDLPKTFREAVEVTRRLGIRYLWIDSLCILQDRDDLSDWLVEAGLMHKVYSHSYFNISAAGSQDSSIGLFFKRDSRLSLSADITICAEGLGLDEDYVDCSIVDLEFWSHAVGQCPLNKRGWVLQERLLSPRVLHFGRDQLYWECREHAAAECYPDALPKTLRDGVPAKFKRMNPAVLSSDADQEEAVDPFAYHRIWNSIVRSYSDTRLTKASDKLIALSGIAKNFQTKIIDTYVVGMWRSTLESSLLWHVSRQSQIDGSPSVRPEPYRAPTFSWASMDGRIATAGPTGQKLLIEVVSLQLDHVSQDTTGLVTGGFLDLKCQPRSFQMVVNYIGELQQLFLKVGDIIVKSKHKRDWDNGVLVHLDVGQESFEDENTTGSLYYVPTQEQDRPDDHLSYLLLVAVDKTDTTFRRIGIAVTAEAEEIGLLSTVDKEVRTIRIV